MEERLRPLFPHLTDPSEGTMQPPAPSVVLDVANRRHWPDLSSTVSVAADKGEDASRQKPLGGLLPNLDIIKKVIRRIGRAQQFGLGEADEEAGSGSDCENDDALE